MKDLNKRKRVGYTFWDVVQIVGGVAVVAYALNYFYVTEYLGGVW